jgi:hypothetical protein
MKSCLVSFLIAIAHVSNNFKACHFLHPHVLALELDMEVFEEMLELLVQVPIS